MVKKKSKIVKHLKGDIKTFKKEASEDRELIKDLKNEKETKNSRSVQSKRKSTKKDARRANLKKVDAKFKKVKKEFKEHKLHSGSKTGPLVTNPKQMVAIAYSEARRAVRKRKK